MNELQDVKLCSRLKYIACKQIIYLAIIFIVSKLRLSYYEINIGHVLVVYINSIYTNGSNTSITSIEISGLSLL